MEDEKLFSNGLRIMRKAFKNPDWVFRLASYKIKEFALWDHYYASLREPKVKGAVTTDPEVQDAIIKELKINEFRVTDYEIDVTDFKKYLNNAEYHKFRLYYDGGKGAGFIEKSLEHYLAAKLLALSKDDVYVDIANANSPAPEIYHRLYDCQVYRQDLGFPKGIHGNVIGGDAGDMPVRRGSITKMALHCSFEHFENGSDIRFVIESSRVLRKGGKLCILPLYLFSEYAIQTDPAALPKGGIPFEKDATLYCVRSSGIRHSRFYDVPNLITRIRNNLNDLKLRIFFVQNEKEVDPSCYVKLMALFEKA